MKINGNATNVIWASVLTGAIIIFIFLSTGISGRVESNVSNTHNNRERIIALEVQMKELQEMKQDVKEILATLNQMK